MKREIFLLVSVMLASGSAVAASAAADSGATKTAAFTKSQLSCTYSIPKLQAKGGGVSFRVSVTNCHGAAGIITTGKFSNFFSWSARDGGGSDRIPDPNCAVNSCSVAKVQSTMHGTLEGLNVKLWCLGTPGTSSLGRTFRRITGKQPAVTRNPATDIVRYCINPTVNKN